MVHLKRISTLAIALLAVAVLTTGSSTALAHGGSSDDSNSSSTSSNSGSGSGSNSGENESETEHSVSAQKKAEFRQRASDDVNNKLGALKGKQAKNKQERQKRCEAHKQGLNTKFDRIVTHGQKIQAKIDKILDKATAYKTDNNLTPANWDDLLATAQAAQATSAQSITDLQNVTPTIDCNSDSVASDVATFKAAAATTRDNLKAYKTSVKALLKSLKEAKQPTTTEGSN